MIELEEVVRTESGVGCCFGRTALLMGVGVVVEEVGAGGVNDDGRFAIVNNSSLSRAERLHTKVQMDEH